MREAEQETKNDNSLTLTYNINRTIAFHIKRRRRKKKVTLRKYYVEYISMKKECKTTGFTLT